MNKIDREEAAGIVTRIAAELETLEALGYVHRLPSAFGCRWIILDHGKEALANG